MKATGKKRRRIRKRTHHLNKITRCENVCMDMTVCMCVGMFKYASDCMSRQCFRR